jgi:hypothetical protein
MPIAYSLTPPLAQYVRIRPRQHWNLGTAPFLQGPEPSVDVGLFSGFFLTHSLPRESLLVDRGCVNIGAR